MFIDTVDVAGPGDYRSGDFPPATAGSYYWIAPYSGDVNNLPSTGTCTGSPAPEGKAGLLTAHLGLHSSGLLTGINSSAGGCKPG